MANAETQMTPNIAYEESSTDLDNYRKMVGAVARAADGRVIVNRSGAHASVVIEYVLLSAEAEVDILTGELYPPIYGAPNVAAALGSFLERHDAHLRILSENVIEAAHPLHALLASHKGKVEMRVMPDRLAEVTPFHFMVADGCCFRFEGDKKTFQAHARYGEPQVGLELQRVFQRLFEKSERTPL